MSKILVTGGAGYIGSHTIVDLVEKGYEVISIDNHHNSSSKSIENISKILGKVIHNYAIDLCDAAAVANVFDEHPGIEGVIHFAALKSVGDSMSDPIFYFRNNMGAMINVLEQVQKRQVKAFIFSSSCTVYGNAAELPVTESTPMKPAESPYGRTKQFGEQMIQDTAPVCPDTRFISLRYFNPAGAHDSGLIGESAINKATNLVPVITETANGKRSNMSVFGKDYDTRDGTCIRDYIHVMDLADAHTKALQFALNKKSKAQIEVFNLGIGAGVSVLEAINAFEKVSGTSLQYEMGPRRAGDVVAIYADKSKAANLLGWKPNRNIEDIMRTAWAWELDRKF